MAGPERIEVPYGTAQFSASFTPENTTLKHVYWTVTEPDGSETDKAEIDGEGLLKVKHLDGQVLVTATAADTGAAKGSRLVTLDLDPALLRGNAARWPGVKATASSEFDAGYPAAKVHDGVIGQKDSGDWASRGEREPWVQLDFAEPVRTDRIAIYDRPGTQDDINGGELTFSDGSSVSVTGIPADGSAKIVEFPLRTVAWVRFQGRGGTGQNPGLSELEVYAIPDPPEAPETVAVTRTGEQAKVTWTAPPFDGGAPVIEYLVRTYRDGAVVAEQAVDGLEVDAAGAGRRHVRGRRAHHGRHRARATRAVKRALLLVSVAAALLGAAAPAQAARDYVGLVNPWVEADIGRP